MLADEVKGFARLKFEVAEKFNALGLRVSIFFLLFMLFFSLVVFSFSSRRDFNNAAAYAVGYLAVSTYRPEAVFYYTTPNGSRVPFAAGAYREQEMPRQSIEKFKRVAYLGGAGAALMAGAITFYFIRLFSAYQSNNRNKKIHIRGAKIVSAEDLEDLVQERRDVTPFKVAGITIPDSLLMKHISFSGDTGQGKSQAIMAMLEAFRQAGKKAFILDKNGEMMTHFYNPDTDYVLGPFDDRSMNWTPYLEGIEEVDTERISRSFIPSTNLGKDDHWPESAVTVLSTLMYQVAHQVGFKGDIDELLISLIESKKVVEKDLLGRDTIVVKRKLYELLSGTLASASVDPDAAEHASSVIATITPKIRSMRFLRGLEKRQKFSIRDWVKNKDDKGWLFIRVNEDEFDAVKPLVSAWIDTAIKTMLSTTKTETIELVGLVDELQSIDKINTLAKAVNEGRKFGLFMMLGFTAVHELYELYGRDRATAMLSQCGTKLLFMTSNPEGQKYNAELLGKEEAVTEQGSMTYGDRESRGANEHRDSQRFIVMPSEVASLAPLTAYLKFSGDWPVAKVKIAYKNWPVVAPPTLPRILPAPLVIPQMSELPSPSESLSVAKPTGFGQAYMDNEPLI